METHIPDSSSTVKVTVKPPADPDLIDLKVRNPVTYLKAWWKKVMAGQGVDFKLKIPAVTLVLIILAFTAGGFGVSRATLYSFLPSLKPKTTPMASPQASLIPNDWRDQAVTGTLKITPNTNKYYLLTSSYIAISLQFNEQIDLNKYLGKRILASGSYNQKSHTLIVSDVLDLEVLPASPVPVVTLTPSPSPVPTETPAIESSPTST